MSTDAGDKRLTICRCKLKEDPAPAGGAATDVPASELVRFDRFRDGGWVKKLRRGCRDGCRRPRPVTCGTQFAREGAQRESDRRRLSSLVDQPLAQSGCLCVTPNRRFCGNSHLIRRGASFGEFKKRPAICGRRLLWSSEQCRAVCLLGDDGVAQACSRVICCVFESIEWALGDTTRVPCPAECPAHFCGEPLRTRLGLGAAVRWTVLQDPGAARCPAAVY